MKKDKIKILSSEDYYLLPTKDFDSYTGIIQNKYSVHYLVDNCYHRLGGPAYINFLKNRKQYYIHDNLVTKEQHDFYVDLLKLKGLI